MGLFSSNKQPKLTPKEMAAAKKQAKKDAAAAQKLAEKQDRKNREKLDRAAKKQRIKEAEKKIRNQKPARDPKVIQETADYTTKDDHKSFAQLKAEKARHDHERAIAQAAARNARRKGQPY